MTRECRLVLKYVLVDYLSTNLAFLLFTVVRFFLYIGHENGRASVTDYLKDHNVVLEQIFFPIFMLVIYYLLGNYNNVFKISRTKELINTLLAALIGTFFLFFLILVNDVIPKRTFVYEQLLTLGGMLFCVVYIPRYLITSGVARKIYTGRWGFDSLIIGRVAECMAFEKRLLKTQKLTGIRIVGYVNVGDETGSNNGLQHPLYQMSEIQQVCKDNGIKRLIVAPTAKGIRKTAKIVEALLPLDLPIYITPDDFQLIATRPVVVDIMSEPLVDVASSRMSDSTRNIKRLSDIVLSAIALLLLSPVILILAILVKVDTKGPAFFCQERIGYHKKPFKICKLRSMRNDAEISGPALSSADDSRVTRVGHFLRKYRLDELPQFWNVLKGEMSIVGPRPEREYFIKQIIEKAPHYTLIHQVRPGITSWGMVKYGYASSIDQMLERLPYDILYVENASFLLDLKILIYTIRTVFTGRGV